MALVSLLRANSHICGVYNGYWPLTGVGCLLGFIPAFVGFVLLMLDGIFSLDSTWQNQHILWSVLQDGDWYSIAGYFERFASDEIKKKAKTVAAKRNWITKTLGLKIQQERVNGWQATNGIIGIYYFQTNMIYGDLAVCKYNLLSIVFPSHRIWLQNKVMLYC